MFDISVDTVRAVINQVRALALRTDADGGDHDPDVQGHEDLIHGDADEDDFLNEEVGLHPKN